MDTADRLAEQRRRLLIVTAIGFVAWQAPLSDRVQAMSDGVFSIANIVSAGGFFVCAAVLLILFFGWARGVKDRKAQAVLEDELTRHNRAQALAAGFWSMLLAAAGMFALSLFYSIGGAEAAHLLITVGVAAPLLRFAFLERADAPG